MFNDKYAKVAEDTMNFIWKPENAIQTEYIQKISKYFPQGRLNIDLFHVTCKGELIFEKITSLAAIDKYPNSVILNFASAKNPGGGFLRGTVAQEETLARSSNLYPSLIIHKEFYSNNEPPYYSDKAIYSPHVLFFKNDYGDYTGESKSCSVITCAAPNLNSGDYDLNKVKDEFLNRIAKVLKIAILNEEENIILGAWGCGVFKNPPELVAECFKQILKTYRTCFEKIIFAIPDDTNFNVFKEILDAQ